MVRPLFLVCSALSLALAMGCTQPIEEGAASESSASSGTTTSPGPRYVPVDLSGARYNVFVGTVPCVSIAGAGGRWSAAPTFSNDRAFCEYWWGGETTPDTSALYQALDDAGVFADAMVEDRACEESMSIKPAPSRCARPVVSAYFADPGDGGGQYTCRSCLKASVPDSAQPGSVVNVVIPASLVTPTASELHGIFGGTSFGFWQPGGITTFSVLVPRKRVSASSMVGATSCRGPFVVTPSSIVSAGACR
jgi:hypothetical protein